MTGADAPSRRLRRYLRDLIRGHRPRPYQVDPDEAAQIAVAIDLRAARLGAAAPDEDFLARLHRRLADVDFSSSSDRAVPASAKALRRPASRRQVVVVGAATTAAAVAGAALDRTLVGPGTAASDSPTLRPNTGAWYTVALSGDLPEDGVRQFSAGTVIGFVRRTGGQVHAVSGVCSHQGCQLRLDNTSRELRCPCHNAAFALTGVILRYQMAVAPPTLPAIQVREADGQVQVFAPAD
jgi:nitrite reductase/ring-hydroxylating ferredoxin subunit